MAAAPNTHTIDSRTYAAVERGGCEGCAAANGSLLCDSLPACSEDAREDYRSVVWIEVVKPAAKRLTKDDINELKKQAVEKFGATWLHEFGALIEAEVYRRLGAALPDATEDESAQAALDFDAAEKGAS